MTLDLQVVRQDKKEVLMSRQITVTDYILDGPHKVELEINEHKVRKLKFTVKLTRSDDTKEKEILDKTESMHDLLFKSTQDVSSATSGRVGVILDENVEEILENGFQTKVKVSAPKKKQSIEEQLAQY